MFLLDQALTTRLKAIAVNEGAPLFSYNIEPSRGCAQPILNAMGWDVKPIESLRAMLD